MGKLESLNLIRSAWTADIPLGQKASTIAGEFYASGLDLGSTAAYVGATPAELDALLSIGGLDDEILEEISRVNPSKTTWTFLSNATDEEISHALGAIEAERSNPEAMQGRGSLTEFVYYTMIEVAAPTIEQKAAKISGEALQHALKKSEQFDSNLSDWDKKFLNSVAGQRKANKELTEKQGKNIARICNNLADRGVITRNSIDGDQAICDEILDAIER